MPPAPRGTMPPPALAAALLILACGGAACVVEQADTPDRVAADVAPEPAATPDALSARVLSDSTALVAGDTLELHAATVPFYRGRAFAPAWLDTGARDSLLAALAVVEDEGLRPEYVGADRLLPFARERARSDTAAVDRELLLSDAYFRLADALLGRRLDVVTVYRYDWHVGGRTAPTTDLLTAALAGPHPGAALSRVLDVLRPTDPDYRAMRVAMARARRDDGTPALDAAARLAAGDTSDVTPLLRRRLARTGDWLGRQPATASARIFDPALADALRRFQARAGLEASAELDDATRAALNRPGRDAVPLMAVNLERWRWMPSTLGDHHIIVNIPQYELQLRRRTDAGWRSERTMPVVVGRSGRWRTPVFSDTITQVVFNPTWTIPASIQMESYGRVDPRGIVRGPGPGNPLGRVKFVFPNPHGIYLHDTNSRRSLSADYRALSHGCIRLADPRGLAGDLVTGPEWDSTRVAARFNGPWVTEEVDLEAPLPVHLVYFTALPGPGGVVERVDDVYGWDAPLARALGFDEADLAAARAATPAPRRPEG